MSATFFFHWKYNRKQDRNYVQGIIDDCYVLCDEFHSISLTFTTSRMGNRVAHELAGLAFLFHGSYWIEKVPQFVV